MVRSSEYLCKCGGSLYKNCMVTKTQGDERKDADSEGTGENLTICGHH